MPWLRRLWGQIFIGLCCCLSLTNTAWGLSKEHILDRAYWQDTHAQASFETAREQHYTPYEGIFSQGYTDSAHWIRLTILASEHPLGLWVTPAWLDSITLFDPATGTSPITVGDRHPIQNNALPGMGHSFELAASKTNRDVWLRLQSTSSHFMDVQALEIDQVPIAASQQIAWAAFYTAMQMMVLLVMLSIWWVQRDHVLSAYLLRHTVYTVYGMAYLGLPSLMLSDWLRPEFFDLAFSVSAITVVSAGLFFDSTLLASYRPHKKLLILLKVIGLLSLGLLLVLMMGHVRLALQTNVLILLVGTVVMALTAITCQPDPTTQQIMPKKFMVVYYMLIAISLFIGLTNVLGLVDVQSWTAYVLIQHGLLSGLMMAGILLVRAQRLAKQSNQMTWQLQKAQLDMAKEQRQSQMQSQFLHMLMHELKTPLSVVSVALGTKTNREVNLGHAARAIQEMKAIIERCVQSDQLGQLVLTQHRENVDVVALIRQQALNIPMLSQRLRIQAPAQLPGVQSDKQLLQIVLGNLLDNAHSYSDPLTDVMVHVHPENCSDQHGLRVSVSNTPGMAGWPDENKLFQKYYRAVGAQTKSGSGLGLFLSRQLVQSLGGTLHYAPSAQLVKLTLWLPLNPI
jgi:signal transduction histidine kinase